jgi:hypothetical protein
MDLLEVGFKDPGKARLIALTKEDIGRGFLLAN